ncbi:MAG: SAM-dependent methyltransferase [Haliea sp.]|uniref:class I SAM-dependent methyltransferase n=1 Tax=Haliea sp. TaxID=1932666 RepID=UPI000C487EDF|nr:methyltransferase domain-containing protein [Haliea sp.]MBM70878.1 SAM-dependent methyltransferase [Haliea sp.]
MKSALQYIPPFLKRFARILFYFFIDAYRSLTRTRRPMSPPAMTALLVGGGDFAAIGAAIKHDLVVTTGLNKSSAILEIGCGYGRVAIALADLVSPPGRYDGVEIVEKAVEWCTNEITSRYPNFLFHHADVSNPYAGRENGQPAAKYRLPFENSTYDVVFLTSVFSHMRPDDISAYLNEISRVMRRNGKCFITYYLINEFTMAQILSKQASQNFCYDFGDFLSTHKRTPEQTIAVSEELVRGFYVDAGLVIEEPILHGSWSNRERHFSYQDVIVAKKP